MIDTLVAFGCSNTYGSETINIGDTTNIKNIYQAYPYFLSQKLNIANYINYARVSASNFEIAYKVYNYIIKADKQYNKNTLLVIGWSGDERFPLFIKDKFSTLRQKTTPKDADYQNTTAINSIFRNFFFETPICTFLNAFVRTCITFILERYEIPYITIPTILYNNHQIYQLLNHRNNVLCYDQDDNIVFNFYDFKQRHSPGKHLMKDEHEKFAEWLYEYIVKNKTLSDDTIL
jgi:hypothetical protein